MTATISKGRAQAVFTAKKGLYEFLVVEMEYFLPPCNLAPMDFLRDIVTGKKKVRILSDFCLTPLLQVLKAKDVTVAQFPHI